MNIPIFNQKFFEEETETPFLSCLKSPVLTVLNAKIRTHSGRFLGGLYLSDVTMISTKDVFAILVFLNPSKTAFLDHSTANSHPLFGRQQSFLKKEM